MKVGEEPVEKKGLEKKLSTKLGSNLSIIMAGMKKKGSQLDFDTENKNLNRKSKTTKNSARFKSKAQQKRDDYVESQIISNQKLRLDEKATQAVKEFFMQPSNYMGKESLRVFDNPDLP